MELKKAREKNNTSTRRGSILGHDNESLRIDKNRSEVRGKSIKRKGDKNMHKNFLDLNPVYD